MEVFSTTGSAFHHVRVASDSTFTHIVVCRMPARASGSASRPASPSRLADPPSPFCPRACRPVARLPQHVVPGIVLGRKQVHILKYVRRDAIVQVLDLLPVARPTTVEERL
jgi:hypothetical protein